MKKKSAKGWSLSGWKWTRKKIAEDLREGNLTKDEARTPRPRSFLRKHATQD